MAKAKKTTQISIFSCFRARKRNTIHKPMPKKVTEKLTTEPRTLVRSISSCEKRKSSRASSKSRDQGVVCKPQASNIITRSKSREALKKTEKTGKRKSKISRKIPSGKNRTIYEYALSSKDTEAPSECTNADFTSQRRLILSKEIQVETASQKSQPQKGLKRKKSVSREVVKSIKRRKTSEDTEVGQKGMEFTTLTLKSNQSTLALNESLPNCERSSKGGIPQKSFRVFKESQIFRKPLELSEEENSDSEDDCDSDEEEIKRAKI